MLVITNFQLLPYSALSSLLRIKYIPKNSIGLIFEVNLKSHPMCIYVVIYQYKSKSTIEYYLLFSCKRDRLCRVSKYINSTFQNKIFYINKVNIPYYKNIINHNLSQLFLNYFVIKMSIIYYI